MMCNGRLVTQAVDLSPEIAAEIERDTFASDALFCDASGSTAPARPDYSVARAPRQ